MVTLTKDITDFQEFKHAKVSYIPNKRIGIITATTEYIPIEEFKKIFHATEEIIRSEQIEKLIFDKRALKVFHQPSMEWYFIEWKEKMFNLGLKKHRKILPDDKIFRESVKIGRQKILSENPSLKVNEMEILYFESLEEAIEK